MNESILKDVLSSLSDDTKSNDYARGILMGVISGIIASGQKFEDVVSTVKQYMPNNIDPERIPDRWKDNFQEFIKPPMCKITGSEVTFSLEVPVSEIEEKAKHIFHNPLEYSDYDGEAAYYNFLKFLWIKYPDGTEKQLGDLVK